MEKQDLLLFLKLMYSSIQSLVHNSFMRNLPAFFLGQLWTVTSIWLVGCFVLFLFFCEEKVEILAAWSKTLLDLVYVKHSGRAQYRTTWLWLICAIASLLC